MKLRNLIFAAFAMVFAIACENTKEDLGLPKIDLGTEELVFDIAGGEKNVTFVATRDWMVENNAEWIAVAPASGSASSKEQTISVTVLENTKMDREAEVVITIGMASRSFKVKQSGPGGSADQLVIYFNDFDKEEAQKKYGSGSSYPYLDQFDGWRNEKGTGIAGVSYSYNGMSTRSNSTSDSNYSDYAGSGSNNLFFGSNAYFAISGIALNGTTDIALTFGTEKYSQDNGSLFTPSEFHIWLSQDAKKWVELTDYTFAGTAEGRWNVASSTFSVPSSTKNLSICFSVDVASSYRIDDLSIAVSETAGKAVDFSNADEKDFGTGGSTGGDVPTNIIDVTVAQFNEKPVSTTEWYRLKGTVGGPINTTYGNFDIIDETGKVYVYGISNWSEFKSKVAEGGSIVVVGNRGDYNGKIEVLKGYIESYDGQGAENPGGGDDPVEETGEYDPQGITWTLGTNAYDNTSSGTAIQTAVVNGVKVNNLLKLGKTSEVGEATIHIPAGTAKVSFYAMSWNKKPAQVKITMGGNSMTINPPANAGVSGNPPYTITLAEDKSDYFEIDVPVADAVDVKVETVDTSAPRVVFIGLKAIAR